MNKYRLPVIAFIVVGTLNLLSFVYMAGHPEYQPAAYSEDAVSASNGPAQVPAWIGHMP